MAITAQNNGNPTGHPNVWSEPTFFATLTGPSSTLDADSPPLLDAGAEGTALPPGLLDSPPRDDDNDAAEENCDAATTTVHRFVDNIAAPPTPAVLPHPPSSAALVQPATEVIRDDDTPKRRCSVRQRLANLANQSGTKSAQQKAVEVKLKWLGLDAGQPSNKVDKKKKQYISMYTGPDKETAESAIHDLLCEEAVPN